LLPRSESESAWVFQTFHQSNLGYPGISICMLNDVKCKLGNL
jgi:hypothetical protein